MVRTMNRRRQEEEKRKEEVKKKVDAEGREIRERK